ncbi:MAG: ABC transporter substrate-binding protein [Rhodoferax sp.]|nr:ABC transporter substrate-binding protein [Rhodoferax sp.]
MTLRKTYLALAMSALLALSGAGPALAQKKGGDVVIAMTAAPPSLDPHATSAQVARNVNLHIFETLFARDENARPVPDLATGVNISADGLTYVFPLRAGVKFHNGKDMTSADVVASLERYRKAGASPSLVAAIDSVTATGPLQVTIKLKTVQSTFLGNLSSPRAPIAIMPAEEAAKEMGKASSVGTGPYRFVEYKPDSHIKVARFDGYKPNPAYKDRDGFAGAKVAYLDSVTFRFMPEAGARDAALETGQVQLNETTDGPTAKRLRGNANFQVIPVLPFAAMILKFNMAKGIGADPNFRRAVAQSLDFEEIMAVAYPDIYRIDTSWVYGGSAYHTNRKTPKQDLAGAKATLAKSGYKGEKVTFIVHNDRPTVDTATVIQQQAAQIGVNIDVKVADWPTTSKMGLGSDDGWNLWTHGFGIEPYEGPASAMSHWVKGQGQRKADPVIDALFDKFNGEMNVEVQKKLFADFEDRMADQTIAVNMGNYGLFQVATSKLKNFKAYRIPRMWGVWLD